MIALYVFLFCYALWVLYLAIMCLKRARDEKRLSKIAYYLGLPLLYVGLFLDFILNVTIGSVLFLQLPREFTLSKRLERHIHAFTWRGAIARWLEDNLLGDFDPRGYHVK